MIKLIVYRGGENMATREKWVNTFITPKALLILIVICAGAFFIYNLPVFWSRPKTSEYLPKEGEGAYLGISSAGLNKAKANLSHYKMNGFLTGNCFYAKKITGELFEGAHYTSNFYGMITDIDFSRHFKEQELEKKKYEYLKSCVSRYGRDFKKALMVYTPFKDARYTYELFVWEKKDASIILEFSFYNNNKYDGYIAKDRGVFLHIRYPGDTGTNFFNKIVKDQENPELKERFKLNFPDLEKKLAD